MLKVTSCRPSARASCRARSTIVADTSTPVALPSTAARAASRVDPPAPQPMSRTGRGGRRGQPCGSARRSGAAPRRGGTARPAMVAESRMMRPSDRPTAVGAPARAFRPPVAQIQVGRPLEGEGRSSTVRLPHPYPGPVCIGSEREGVAGCWDGSRRRSVGIGPAGLPALAVGVRVLDGAEPSDASRCPSRVPESTGQR
jgi:hypothetical protein